MNRVVIKHVRVSELPKAWRARLAANADACVTVRIEEEQVEEPARAPEQQESATPAFGMWADRGDLADVNSYVRRLRAPRHASE